MTIRNIKRLVLAALAVAAITPIAFLNDDASAAASIYKDYSEIPKVINQNFAPAKIYYTPDTIITVKQVGRTGEDEPPAQIIYKKSGGDNIARNRAYKVDPGSELVILVENSTARDNNNNPVDVIWRINNVNNFTKVINIITDEDVTDSTEYLFSFALRLTTCGTDNPEPTADDCTIENSRTLGENDPILFWLNSRFSSGDFSVEYIKKGTYNANTTHGTAANVTNISYMSFDYDVVGGGYEVEGSPYFGSHEGSRGNSSNSTTTYYYHKNAGQTDTVLLSEYDSQNTNGLYIDTLNHSSEFNGLYYGGSFYATASITNATYTMTYSATTAGICNFFGSPVAYDTPAPTKAVNKTSATTGNSLAYTISQYVPENYSSTNDLLTFAAVYAHYDNIEQDHNYSSFSITDTLDSHLTAPNASSVKVYNGTTDVTNNFTVAVNGQTITVTAKSDYLTNPAFYGTTLYIKFNARINDPIDVGRITNNTKNSFTYTGITTPTEKTSNTVTTNIYHILTVKHLDKDTGEAIIDDITEIYSHGSDYETEAADELPEGYELVETPENAEGVMESDVTVIYYYKKPKNPNTLDSSVVPFAGAFTGASLIVTGLYFAISKRR